MARKSESFTQHPLFPALLTMWFGATFGLSSLVIGQATLESWAVASGLPQYLAAAQPPLGSTARVLLALAACAGGSLVGLGLAALLVREESPAGDDAMDAPYAQDEADEAFEGAEPDVAESDVEPELEADDEAEIEPVVVEHHEAEAEIETSDADPMAPFFRNDAAQSHAPRAPFSVFDELGPDAGIVEVSEADEHAGEVDHVPELDEPLAAETGTPVVETAATDAEPAPAFSGSPPLPGNVHAIGARFAQRGLPPHFANDSAPEPVERPVERQVDTPEQAEPAQSAPSPEQGDLATLSYVQLTERLAKAIAKNPQPPASLRRRSGSEGPNTAVASPGLERLRKVHARTAPANESPLPDADDIRDALSGLRNLRGAS